MKEFLEDNRKIFVEKNKHHKFKELKSSSSSNIGIFNNMKDVFIASAMLGYSNDKRESLNSNRDIFDVNVLKKHDYTLIYSIFLDYTGDADLLEKGEIMSVIEEYANAGIDILYDIVNQSGDALNNLVEEIQIYYL